MAYTVKQVAEMSGVSIRTLHFYDEIGLLKPAYHGSNGYRFYEEEQLLILQQILFFRELGFELKKIQKILSRKDFDKMIALSAHRQILQKSLSKTKELIKTIDKTLEHLKGTKKMKDQEMYHGLSQESQEEYEKQIIQRFGRQGQAATDECRHNVKNWSKPDWDRSKKEGEAIAQDLAAMMNQHLTADSRQVQGVIRRHYEWLKQFWTPTQETYAAHGQFIVESDLGSFYKAFHPQMPEFIAKAIQVFANRELSE